MTHIRRAQDQDRLAISNLVETAFEGKGEAILVARLVDDGDVVLELVAEQEGQIIGQILFSRLTIHDDSGETTPAVALAPLCVSPDHQGQGVGSALVTEGHRLLIETGETLSIVLGDPAYYGHFDYTHERAASFRSLYQSDALQAVAWGDAPTTGRLAYAPAFEAL